MAHLEIRHRGPYYPRKRHQPARYAPSMFGSGVGAQRVAHRRFRTYLPVCAGGRCYIDAAWSCCRFPRLEVRMQLALAQTLAILRDGCTELRLDSLAVCQLPRSVVQSPSRSAIAEILRVRPGTTSSVACEAKLSRDAANRGILLLASATADGSRPLRTSRSRHAHRIPQIGETPDVPRSVRGRPGNSVRCLPELARNGPVSGE